jgi:hypothetical protein
MVGASIWRAVGSFLVIAGSLGWLSEQAQAQGAAPGTGAPPAPPNMSFLDPRTVSPAPRLPHELKPDAWPQPDYFKLALQLAGRKPNERASSLRLRLPADRPVPPYIVLPVQTQAFGFSAPFRALLGAELDAQLDRQGIVASRQTDVVDAQGPFVRRLDEAAIIGMLGQTPASKAVVLHAGHDGAQTLFLTLVVRDAKGQTVAHRNLPLPDDPEEAIRGAAAALAELIKTAGLPLQPRVPQAGTACELSAWSLANLPVEATSMSRACAAVAAASLLPDFDATGMPGATQSTESRLALLAQAYAQAALARPESTESQAIRQLAWAQLGLSRAQTQTQTPGVSGLLASKDPVVSRVARLVLLPVVRHSPVQSEREGIRRQIESVAKGLPDFAQAAVQARGDFADSFGAIDWCALERGFPGAMPSPACRSVPGQGPSAPARPASRAEWLVFQEWRLAVAHHALRRLAVMQGLPDRARDFAKSMPADLASHPFVQRLSLGAGVAAPSTGSFEDLLKSARELTDATVANMVDLQRHDSWVGGYSLSEHVLSSNTNVSMDPKVQDDQADDSRLLGVLKYDRFTVGFQPPYRRRAGDTAFFLRPERQLMHFGLMDLRFAQAALTAPAAPASGQAPAAPWVPPPLFGNGKPWQPALTPQELARNLAQNPSDMGTRVELALAQLKRGGSMADALKLIDAQPVNQRADERIGESHRWAAPAHAFFFAAEPEAALRYYERVAAIGTGSQSDLHARGRIPLLRGRLPEAFEAIQARQRRYDSDFARRDVAGLLFMQRQPDAAWSLLLPRAALSESMQLWDGIMVGHRQSGLEPGQAVDWLKSRQLQKAQVQYKDVRSYYPHQLAVLDRVPTESDVAMLKKPAGGQDYVDPLWAMSAQLIRTSINGGGEEAVRQQVLATLKDSSPDQVRFMLPSYVWVAWKATQGTDDLLTGVRKAEMDVDFDGLLAKSVVLALDGRTDESLRYLGAARFTLAELGLGTPLLDRLIPATYQFALAGTLMYQHTRIDAYRHEMLRYARAYQKVIPFLAWPHALEALMEREEKPRLAAACRAWQLDRGSHFLQRAAVPGLSATACKNALW